MTILRETQSSRPGLVFDLNLKVSVLTALVFPLLLALGHWQLQRAEEKRHIAAQWAARQELPPVALESLPANDDPAFRRLQLSGAFDNAHNILLDNRIRDGRVGYEVLTPFRDRSGRWVLINRGWLAAGPTRQQLPQVPPITAPGANHGLTVVAQIYVPPGKPMLLETQRFDAAVWPRVIQAVEMDKLAMALNRELFPHQVRIEAGEPGALLARWQAPTMRPQQHTAYAVQWFALALALVLWFVFAHSNLWQLLTGDESREFRDR